MGDNFPLIAVVRKLYTCIYLSTAGELLFILGTITMAARFGWAETAPSVIFPVFRWPE